MQLLCAFWEGFLMQFLLEEEMEEHHNYPQMLLSKADFNSLQS